MCVCHKLLVATDLISAITQNPFEHSHRLLVQGTRDNFLVSRQKYGISAAERRKERPEGVTVHFLVSVSDGHLNFLMTCCSHFLWSTIQQVTTVLPAPLTLQRSHTVQNYYEFCTCSEGKADLHSQDTHTQGRTRLLRGGHTL